MVSNRCNRPVVLYSVSQERWRVVALPLFRLEILPILLHTENTASLEHGFQLSTMGCTSSKEKLPDIDMDNWSCLDEA